jgi:mRNA deadenylase 3'-5' endonuclease subunit Ccr4
MRISSFNVLADSYIGYGNYDNADQSLLKKGTRTKMLAEFINNFEVDIIALQEVEKPLLEEISTLTNFQTFWMQKLKDKPDG